MAVDQHQLRSAKSLSIRAAQKQVMGVGTWGHQTGHTSLLLQQGSRDVAKHTIRRNHRRWRRGGYQQPEKAPRTHRT
jgi:hypothetical protein